MRATEPSNTSKLTPTRLRGSGVTVEVTSTPYLPLDRYCCFSSYSARSSMERSKMRPSAKPTWRQRGGDCLGIELAHAVEVNGGDGRAFLDDHDDDIIVRLDLNVGEKARAIQDGEWLPWLLLR